MERSIIHLNVADFAAAIETGISPGLKNHPFIIAPLGTPRARVFDMNDPAFREGIRKGMDLARARRMTPGIKILPPKFNRYEQAMGQITQKALAYTPRVEPGRADGHIFLDMTGTSRLFGPPVDVAFRLRKALQRDLGLDPIWALATTRIVAKVATRLVKPLGEYIVAPGEEADFLEPLSLSLVPGIDREELETLTTFNLSRVSQLRLLSPAQLEIPFPGRSRRIHDLIRGIDPEPVSPAQTPGTKNFIRTGREFGQDTNDPADLRSALYEMVEEICTDLRRRNMAGRSAEIILSYSDGIQGRAAGKLSTTLEPAMFKICDQILIRAWARRVRIRHMELICTKGPARPVQDSLFRKKSKQDSQENISRALDKIRARFGPGIVRTGLTLDRSGQVNRLKVFRKKSFGLQSSA
ncbi:DNA polymerase Y family protein [Desulfospira joergensenii]|uniref:DNA polymerase Y family protein n=1 Tax=Desulfospira joergensenii TaxID=53329 RepID=UPI0003B5E85E|nr:hypothetical protein [Desulfospira joergensenii]